MLWETLHLNVSMQIFRDARRGAVFGETVGETLSSSVSRTNGGLVSGSGGPALSAHHYVPFALVQTVVG